MIRVPEEPDVDGAAEEEEEEGIAECRRWCCIPPSRPEDPVEEADKAEEDEDEEEEEEEEEEGLKGFTEELAGEVNDPGGDVTSPFTPLEMEYDRALRPLPIPNEAPGA